jgi:hypothetical protein
MLTDEQMNSGLINTARRWPNRVVPFVIDRVFSEYCSTKLQSGLRGAAGIIHALWYRWSSSAHWRLGGRSNGDSYLSLPHKTVSHTHTLTHSHIKAAM